MNFTQTGVTAALIASAIGFGGTSAAVADDQPSAQFLSLATSSVGGSWYPLGAAMAAIITAEYPQLNVNTEVTGGTADNLNLLGNEQVDLAFSTGDQAYLASVGEGGFSDGAITNFKGLIGGHTTMWQLYTLRGTGITSIEDLRGKRVSLGGAGSIGNEVGQLVIEAHGLEMGSDWQPEYLGHSDGTGALRDGRVDAVLQITSAPAGSITDITSTHGDNVVFVNPDPVVLEELLEQFPYWSPATIPGGAYRGHDEDIEGTFALTTILVASESLDDATAYAVTKAILENQDALRAAHALGAEWNREAATRGIDGLIPFHPGAERYLKEQGLLD